jgi:phosphinothricin acetyltransferase
MSETRIRYAERDDLPRIVDIYNATIPSREVTADTEPVSVESRIQWFEAHRRDKRPLWVAEDARGIAGWLSISTFYGRPAYDGTVELSVYVADDRRGRGLGSMLMRHALAQAPALGIDALIGFIFRHNRRSLQLFHNHGFERWGVLPAVAVLDGTPRDVIIVGRKLAV